MSVGLDRREDALDRLGGRSENAVREGELDFGVHELESGCSLAVVLSGDGGGADDLDGSAAGSVATSHVVVEGVNSRVEVGVSVFSVHIVGAASGVVLDPNAKVLNIARVLLGDFVAVKDLTSGLLHLVHLVKEVPEAGLGHNLVLGENFL